VTRHPTTHTVAATGKRTRMDITRMEEGMNELGERVRPQIEAARRRLRTLNGQATQIIKDHPATCLLGAVAVGYLVARLARGSS
jgi:hypothetical protein